MRDSLGVHPAQDLENDLYTCWCPASSRSSRPHKYQVGRWLWDPVGPARNGNRPDNEAKTWKTEWKTALSFSLDRGKNGQKMAQKWIIIFEEFSIFPPFPGHFLAISAPVKLGAVFHSVFHIFFPHYQAGFHSVQARQVGQDPKGGSLRKLVEKPHQHLPVMHEIGSICPFAVCLCFFYSRNPRNCWLKFGKLPLKT